MKTQTITLYIHKRVIPSPFSREDDIEIIPFDKTGMEHRLGEFVVIGTHVVDVPIPDVDVTAQAIEALEGRADDVMARARAEVSRIHEQIQNLRCLEHKEEA